MTRGPSRYKIPALCDVPAELNVHLLVNAENPNAIHLSKLARIHTGPLQFRTPDTNMTPTFSFQGIGEPPVFFGATIFFAIKAAIAAARQERELGGIFPSELARHGGKDPHGLSGPVHRHGIIVSQT